MTTIAAPPRKKRKAEGEGGGGRPSPNNRELPPSLSATSLTALRQFLMWSEAEAATVDNTKNNMTTSAIILDSLPQQTTDGALLRSLTLTSRTCLADIVRALQPFVSASTVSGILSIHMHERQLSLVHHDVWRATADSDLMAALHTFITEEDQCTIKALAWYETATTPPSAATLTALRDQVVEESLDLLRALTHWSWCMWWGDSLSVELVVMVAVRLTTGHNHHLLLELLWHPTNWVVQQREDVRYLSVSMDVLATTKGGQLHGMELVLEDAERCERAGTNYADFSPRFIIRQSAHLDQPFTIRTEPLQAHAQQTYHRLLEQTLTLHGAQCQRHCFTVTVPAALLLLLENEEKHALVHWHTIAQHLLTVMSGFKQPEQQTTTLEQASRRWYRQITSHQTLFHTVLPTQPGALNDLIEQSLRLGTRYASRPVNQYDWFDHWIAASTGPQVWAFLTTTTTAPSQQPAMFASPHLERALITSLKRKLLGHTATASLPPNARYWTLSRDGRSNGLRWRFGGRNWYESGDNVAIPFSTGKNQRLETEQSAAFKVTDHANGLQLILSSETLNAQYKWWRSQMVSTQLHDSSPEVLSYYQWLQDLVAAFFARDQQVSKFTSRSTGARITMHDAITRRPPLIPIDACLRHVSRGARSQLESSWVPPQILQALLHYIAFVFLAEPTRDVLGNAWVPTIPATTLILDTVTALGESTSSDSVQRFATDTEAASLLLLTATGCYVVVQLTRISGITIHGEVKFSTHTQLVQPGQQLSVHELSTLMQHALFIMYHHKSVWW